jgi:hypothetical protein
MMRQSTNTSQVSEIGSQSGHGRQSSGVSRPVVPQGRQGEVVSPGTTCVQPGTHVQEQTGDPVAAEDFRVAKTPLMPLTGVVVCQHGHSVHPPGGSGPHTSQRSPNQPGGQPQTGRIVVVSQEHS